MKITKLLSILLLLILNQSCSKDKCPDGPSYTYKYYEISDNVKQTFPYHFKDTQVWINVNTNDTLHYLLKDTMSSYDTTSSIFEMGCPTYNIIYNERFTYNFNCLEDTIFNYNHIYQLDKSSGFYYHIKFNKIEYVENGGKLEDINNFGIIYKGINVSKYFSKNISLGILRITVGNTKLYRIK